MKPFNLFFALILIMGISVNAHSNEEVKLLCNMNLVETIPTGNQRKQHITVVIEVYSNASGYLSIIPQSDDLGAVASQATKGINLVGVKNFSNANKWDLEMTTRSESGRIATTRYVIDRNSGRISYFKDWDSGRLQYMGNGSCEAVAQEKRKF